jgi:molybdate-binding protein
VAAGCDPALPLLETPLGLLDPPAAFSWWPCPSREALELAAAGLVHAAGAHLRGPAGEYNTGPARELLPQGGEVIGFCSWREGLVLRPGQARGIRGVGDVARRGLRLVNREPGTEARSVLDRELATLGIDAAQLPGYGHPGNRAPASGCPPSPPDWPTPESRASPRPWPTAWPSSRWPPSASTWSSRPATPDPARCRAC